MRKTQTTTYFVRWMSCYLVFVVDRCVASPGVAYRVTPKYDHRFTAIAGPVQYELFVTRGDMVTGRDGIDYIVMDMSGVKRKLEAEKQAAVNAARQALASRSPQQQPQYQEEESQLDAMLSDAHAAGMASTSWQKPTTLPLTNAEAPGGRSWDAPSSVKSTVSAKVVTPGNYPAASVRTQSQTLPTRFWMLLYPLTRFDTVPTNHQMSATCRNRNLVSFNPNFR